MKIDIKSFEDMVLDIMLEMKKPDYTTDVINLALSKLTKKQVYEFNGKLTDSMYPRIKVIKKQLNSIGNIKY